MDHINELSQQNIDHSRYHAVVDKNDYGSKYTKKIYKIKFNIKLR